jgi:2'-5' RNA ligase
MGSYVLVAPLRPLAVGDGFSMSAWPLHLTVVGNFATDLSIDEVGGLLTTTASMADVVVGAHDLFGPRNNVRVSVIEHSEWLDALHNELVERMASAGAVFDNPEYTGRGYRPHVTATKRAHVTEGDILRLGQLALVDMRPSGDSGLRSVVWTQSLA